MAVSISKIAHAIQKGDEKDQKGDNKTEHQGSWQSEGTITLRNCSEQSSNISTWRTSSELICHYKCLQEAKRANSHKNAANYLNRIS